MGPRRPLDLVPSLRLPERQRPRTRRRDGGPSAPSTTAWSTTGHALPQLPRSDGPRGASAGPAPAGPEWGCAIQTQRDCGAVRVEHGAAKLGRRGMEQRLHGCAGAALRAQATPVAQGRGPWPLRMTRAWVLLSARSVAASSSNRQRPRWSSKFGLGGGAARLVHRRIHRRRVDVVVEQALGHARGPGSQVALGRAPTTALEHRACISRRPQ